ncbi:MAG: response regulator transcription factor [Planctomycetota bacterium]|jgi:two-component system alkaline phosphatase synthesis response regulator PhoP
MFDIFGLKKKAGKVKILIVDDEPDLVQTLRDRLEMNGYDIITANNGKEGLEKAVEERPNIVLLDVIMPVMDGLEMLEALRKHPENKDCAVIMLTARSQRQDIVRAKVCGIQDYVVKPFDLSELIEKIENIVERHKVVVR